jgi:ATP-dependent DNA helicase RecQ
VTAEGRRLLKAEVKPRLLAPAKKAEKDKSRAAAPDIDSWEGVDHGLFESLRTMRQQLALEQGVPPYIIFHDASLRDMARRRPTTLAGFHSVQGVGEKKLADYGSTVVALIADYCREHSLTTNVTPPPPKPRAMESPPGPSMASTHAFPHFREGLSVEAVAQRMGRALSTVHGYLVDFLCHEKRTDPSPWLDEGTMRRVAAAAEQFGTDRLKPIYEAMAAQGQPPSYEQIRIAVVCLRNGQRAAVREVTG